MLLADPEPAAVITGSLFEAKGVNRYMHFIYVFNKEDKEKLESMGFQLFQSDDLYGTYVFLNNTYIDVAESGTSYITSDSLTL